MTSTRNGRRALLVAPCFHVGNEDSHDRYFRNITVMARDDVYSIIAPPARGVGFKNFEMGQWGITNEFPRQLR